MQIIIRETFSGFANVPNGYAVSDRTEPIPSAKDDGTGVDLLVTLPDGFTVAQSNCRDRLVYDPHGSYCDIVRDPKGRLALMSAYESVVIGDAP